MENTINQTTINTIKYFLSFFAPIDSSKPVMVRSASRKQYFYEIVIDNGVFNSQVKNLETYFGGVPCKVEPIVGSQSSRVLVSQVQLPLSYGVSSLLSKIHKQQGKEISIGIGSFGEETLDIDSITHLGLYGNSGFGKSSFLKYLIAQVLAYRPDVDNVFFDPKGTEFESFKHHPRTVKVASSSDEKMSLIMALKTEMLVREHFFTQSFKMVPSSLKEYLNYRKQFDRKDLPVFNKIFVWADEAHEFIGSNDSSYGANAEIFSSLVLKARSFGIHFVFASQRPEHVNSTLRRQTNNILTFAFDNAGIILDNLELSSIPYISGRIAKMDLVSKKTTMVQVPFTTTEESLMIAYGGYHSQKKKAKTIGFYPLKVNRKGIDSMEFFHRVVSGSKLKDLYEAKQDENYSRRRTLDFKFSWPEIYELYDEDIQITSVSKNQEKPVSDIELKEIKKGFAEMLGVSEDHFDKPEPISVKLKKVSESVLKPIELVMTDNQPKLDLFIEQYKEAVASSRYDFAFCYADLNKNVGLTQILGHLQGVPSSQFVPEASCLALGNDLSLKFDSYLTQARYALNKGSVAPLLIVVGKKGMGKRTIVEVLGNELNVAVRNNTVSDSYGLSSKDDLLKKEVVVFEDSMSAIGFCRQGVVNKVPVLLFEIKEPVETMFGTVKSPEPNFQYLNIDHTFIQIPNDYYQRDDIGQKLIDSILKKFKYKGEAVGVYDFAKNRITMTPFHINAVVERAKTRAEFSGKKLDHKTLISTLEETAKNTTVANSNVRIVKPKFGLDKLVVAKDHKDELEQIIHRARNLRNNKYKFIKNLREGNRVVALFAGPPGTGKSLSAEVIAKELGVECWQADFSRLQGKYVGESEKLFTEVFEQAEMARAVLLIDECDAFLSRGGDSDYSRKMANHILNLVNNYKGILVFTSNNPKDLDGAFNRRIDFKITFKYPEKPQMIEILKNLLLPDAPVPQDLNWEKLVEGISLSGGLLLNAVEKAVLIMEKSGKEELTFEVLRQALEETQKGNDVVEERKRTIGIGA